MAVDAAVLHHQVTARPHERHVGGELAQDMRFAVVGVEDDEQRRALCAAQVQLQAIDFHISRSRVAVQMRGCLRPRASS